MSNKSNISLELQQRFKSICESAGIKLTHQRQEIFKEVVSSTNHPSAEKIHSRLKYDMPTLSLDTVYRTLATFERIGVIKKVNLLDDHARFDSNLSRHHHFICSSCKKIEDFKWPVFDQIPIPEEIERLGVVREKQVEIRGLCNSCLAKRAKN